MNIRRHLVKILIGAALLFAAVLVYNSFRRYTWGEIEQSVLSIHGFRLIAAFGFVILSYFCLSLFDTLAVRYAGKPLAYRRTALASFTSLSIGHNIGMAALSSGTVRYRFYSRWGLTGEDVAKVILFCGVTVGLGLATLGGLALLFDLGGGDDLLGLDQGQRMTIGIVCLGVPFFYLGVCAFVRRPLPIRSWRFVPPSLPLAFGQIIVGTLNFVCVSAALYELLAAFTEAGFLDVATAYVTANLGALISHVPGGLGVLEAVMLNVLPVADNVSGMDGVAATGTAAIGALIAFRVLYFLIPLAIGLPTLLVSEAYYRRRRQLRDLSGHATG
jgi:uncharacterized membrane protein YbhN (UPF0104 family)